MVKDHSDSERGLAARVLFYAPSHRQASTFVTPVVEHWLERAITQWIHHEESIRRPIVSWAKSYHEATSRSHINYIMGYVLHWDVSIPQLFLIHNWCNKGCGMYPVSGMMHIKEPLLLIRKSSPCGGSGFPLSYLSGLLPYVWRHITVNKMCWVRR